MGYYINPRGETKEAWLSKHGDLIHSDQVLGVFDSEGCLPVCLVDNGAFTAAGIAYCPDEARAFLYPDPRPKKWFKVRRTALAEFLPEGVKAWEREW